MSQLIFFNHGNGFPSGAYQAFFDHLAPDFHIQRLELNSHQSQYPVTNNWPYLVEELIQAIKATSQAPLIGMGHSMGGVLTFMAAAQAPHLFKAIVLLDSPILGLLRSMTLRLAKRLRLLEHLLPIKHSRHRKQSFASRQAAFSYFQNRPLFKQFSSASLWDYVNSGLIATEQGFSLRFKRDIESAIFNTMPDNLHRLRLAATINAYLLYSPRSKIVTPLDLRFMKKSAHFQYQAMTQGGHLFPLEEPLLTATAVKNLLSSSIHQELRACHSSSVC